MPGYNFLPMPLWVLTGLNILTFTLHIIAMNLVLGGVIYLLIFSDMRTIVAQRYGILLPSLMAGAVSFGVAPLLFIQLTYGSVVFSAFIISGWFWLSVVAVTIVCYYLLYINSFRIKKGKGQSYIILLLIVIGLLYVSLVFVSIFSLAQRPALMKLLYFHDQSGFVLNPDINKYLFRWLHMISGAVTVAGFFAAIIGRNYEPCFIRGKMMSYYGTIFSVISGIGYLMSFSNPFGFIFRTHADLLITAAVILTICSIITLCLKRFYATSITLFVSLLCMSLVRHISRQFALTAYFNPSSITIAPQGGAFVLFLLSIAAAIVVIIYMSRLFIKGE